jgi:hypothetical protein
MRMEITLPTELSYSKLIEKLKKDKSKVKSKVKYYEETEKNIMEFWLRKYPNCKIQFSPKSRIIIFCKDMENFDDIINELTSVLCKNLLDIPVGITSTDEIKINIYGLTWKDYEKLIGIKYRVKAFLDSLAQYQRKHKNLENKRFIGKNK